MTAMVVVTATVVVIVPDIILLLFSLSPSLVYSVFCVLLSFLLCPSLVCVSVPPLTFSSYRGTREPDQALGDKAGTLFPACDPGQL